MGPHARESLTTTAMAARPPIGERIVLPLPPPPGVEARFEMEIYARFMRHLRHVPNSRMEIKILAAIQFTADMMDAGDALVAKTLADLGLRAPRKAFPVAFLEFADRAMTRSSDSSPPASIMALREYWDFIGEERFSPLMHGVFGHHDGHYARA